DRDAARDHLPVVLLQLLERVHPKRRVRKLRLGEEHDLVVLVVGPAAQEEALPELPVLRPAPADHVHPHHVLVERRQRPRVLRRAPPVAHTPEPPHRLVPPRCPAILTTTPGRSPTPAPFGCAGTRRRGRSPTRGGSTGGSTHRRSRSAWSGRPGSRGWPSPN